MNRTLILASAFAASLAPAATAPAAVALVPATWTAPPEAEVSIEFHQRGAPEADAPDVPGSYRPTAWPADIEWMFVRGGNWHRNLHKPEATNGDARAIPTAAAGATMVGAQLSPRLEQVEPGDLAALLIREGAAIEADAAAAAQQLIEDAGARADEPLRVKIVQCAQTLLRAADGRTQNISSPIALAKAGLAAEIRLLMDPTALVTPSDLGVRLYAGYKSCEDQLVRATNLTTGAEAEATSGEGGIASLAMEEPGAWRIEFASAQVAPADEPGEDADIIIWTCSLSFEMTRTKEGQ